MLVVSWFKLKKLTHEYLKINECVYAISAEDVVIDQIY